MTIEVQNRYTVVLSMVTLAWLSTSDIDEALFANGFQWSTETTRSTLRALADAGKIERRKAGKGYQWRAVPVPAPGPDSREALQQRLDEAAERFRVAYEEVTKIVLPVPDPAPASITSRGDLLAATADTDLPDLLGLDDALTTCIVHRAAYEALKAMLFVLDGWIEGVVEDAEARELRDRPRTADAVTFHANDIRRMVNDAARLVGARPPYAEDQR